MKKTITILLMTMLPYLLQSQTITDGLWAYWSLDNDATDFTTNQTDGTLHSILPAIDRNNNLNSALYFDGNAYIDFGDRLDVGLNDLSICAWFKDNGTSSNIERTIIAKSDYSSKDSRYAIIIQNGVIHVFFDYGPNVNLIGSQIVSDNKWHFVSVTFDRDGEAKLYIDGILDNSGDISESKDIDMQASWPLQIGQYSGYGLNFLGYIDEVSMYNKVLSESEIHTLYGEEVNSNTSQLCENIYCYAGNVGIGKTPDSSIKLDVAGTIRAEEILVEANGQTADFVFAEDYNLKPLSEVEAFIKTNKHLPEIPSATEMEAHGVNLAEMNKLLLQKVEELTLYQIEKDKEVQELEERLAKIEALLLATPNP